MKKLFLIFWFISFSTLSHAGVMMMNTSGATPGTVSADITIDFDGTACGSITDVDGTNGTVDCASTTDPQNGTYHLEASTGAASGIYIDLPSAQTHFWIEGWFKVNGAVTSGNPNRFLSITDSSNNIYFGSGQKEYSSQDILFLYNYGDYVSYNSSATYAGSVYYKLRWHIVLDNSAGVIQMAESTDGSSWDTVIDQSGVDTIPATPSSATRIWFGWNLGDNLPLDQYIDGTINIYYGVTHSPGWSF